jgi:hypothetical protein
VSGGVLLDLDDDGGVGSDDVPLRTKVRVLELQHREKRGDKQLIMNSEGRALASTNRKERRY